MGLRSVRQLSSYHLFMKVLFNLQKVVAEMAEAIALIVLMTDEGGCYPGKRDHRWKPGAGESTEALSGETESNRSALPESRHHSLTQPAVLPMALASGVMITNFGNR